MQRTIKQEWLEGESKIRFSHPNGQTYIAETFHTPNDCFINLNVILYRNKDGELTIASESYTDTADGAYGLNPVSFQQPGYQGPLEDYDYWWFDRPIPEDLPINENVPDWVIEAFVAV